MDTVVKPSIGDVMTENHPQIWEHTPHELGLIAKSIYNNVDRVNSQLDESYKGIALMFKDVSDLNETMTDEYKEELDAKIRLWNRLEERKDELWDLYDKFSDYDLVSVRRREEAIAE